MGRNVFFRPERESKGTFEPKSVNAKVMLLKEVFRRGPKLFPNKIAIVDGKRRFTYKKWGERQNRLVNALLKLGLRAGDRVGIHLRNCAEYFDTFAAAAKRRALL